MPKESSKETTGRKTKKKTTKTATKRKRATKRSTPVVSKKPERTVGGGLLRVRQIRSGIGHAGTYRRTLRAIGLRHHQAVVQVPDNPSMRGMLQKVRHLIEVTPVEA